MYKIVILGCILSLEMLSKVISVHICASKSTNNPQIIDVPQIFHIPSPNLNHLIQQNRNHPHYYKNIVPIDPNVAQLGSVSYEAG